MKIGDKLRVSEIIREGLVEKEGTIVFIDLFKITIERKAKNTDDLIRESFNISDIAHREQKKYINDGTGWRILRTVQRGNRICIS